LGAVQEESTISAIDGLPITDADADDIASIIGVDELLDFNGLDRILLGDVDIVPCSTRMRAALCSITSVQVFTHLKTKCGLKRHILVEQCLAESWPTLRGS
jgi:hypothetical protein